MQAVITPFLPGVMGFLLFVLLLPFAMRLPWPTSSTLRPLLTALVAFPTGLAVGCRLFDVVMPWHSAAAFGFLFMLVWFAFGSIAKSITLLVTYRLLDFQEGAPVLRIKTDVIEREFDTRAALLCDLGYAVKGGGHYAITPAGQAFIGKLARACRIFGIDAKGLYGFSS